MHIGVLSVEFLPFFFFAFLPSSGTIRLEFSFDFKPISFPFSSRHLTIRHSDVVHQHLREHRYPEEIEYLWIPCSYIQPNGDPMIEIVPEGVVTM